MPTTGGGYAGAPGVNAVSRGVADWLCLAAAPSFAFMALLTAFAGGADMICLAAQDASPFSGMTVMYVLMSVFHSAPWVRLIVSRRSGTARGL
ncbi:MAG: hypothetical protein AAAC48_23140 [Phyllobacterium sp.]|uniref:hypothetical protein n=1 Tax=Phyllobacterium sp. TaxID=1871046 RepID=UPI0030F02004